MGNSQVRLPRWLMAVAAFVLAAGIGAAAWSLRASGPVPATPADTTPASLAGSRWTATTIGGRDVVTTDDGAVPHLQFDTATSATGGDPCNGMRSDYTLDGSRLRFAGWVTTEMACGSPQVVTQQGRYAAALTASVSVRLVGGTLDLLDASGTVVLSFTRAPFPTPPITTPASGGPDDPVSSEVEVRVRNDLGFDVAGIGVTFPDGRTVEYGPVAAGAASRYAEAGQTVYRYARVRVTTSPGPPADGRVFTLQPTDFVGEEPLDPGRYTYVLTLVDDQLVLTLH